GGAREAEERSEDARRRGDPGHDARFGDGADGREGLGVDLSRAAAVDEVVGEAVAYHGWGEAQTGEEVDAVVHARRVEGLQELFELGRWERQKLVPAAFVSQSRHESV